MAFFCLKEHSLNKTDFKSKDKKKSFDTQQRIWRNIDIGSCSES